MRFVISILIVMFSSAVFGGEKVNKSLDVQADGVIDIDVVKGDVIIEAWEKSVVKVVGELDDELKKFVFETSGKETLIHVKIDDGMFRGRNRQGSKLTIHIPQKSSVRAEGVSTDFKVMGVQGGLSLETVSGDISLSDVGDSIDLESVSGDVKISAGKGDLNVGTVSGDIDAELSSDEVDIESVSGDVNLRAGKIKEIDISAVSGDVMVNLELLPKGKVQIGTVSGDVELIFAGNVDARFHLEKGPGGDIVDKLTGGEIESSGSVSMKTKMGDASADVSVNTMSGTITIGK